jgi:hypothetical protein
MHCFWFFKGKDKSDEYIQKLLVLYATTFNHVPQRFWKIIRDADYFHFTKDNYSIKCNLLRKEWESTNKAKFTDLEWAKENLKVLSQNHVSYRLCYYKLAEKEKTLK